MGISRVTIGTYSAGSDRQTRPSRSLAPREHGAYGQLALPLAAALGGGRPGIAALGIGAAGVLLFVAHEPLLVALGRRGSRALREDGGRAKHRLLWLGAGAALLGGLGLAFAPAAGRWLTLLPLALGLSVGALVRSGSEKTATGELLAAAALSSVGVPVAVASDTPAALALFVWTGWCVGFASATMAVRTVVASTRERVPPFHRIAGPAALAIIGAALTVAGLIPTFIWMAFVPMTALALGIAARPPGARHLRRIGWTLVGTTTFAALVLATGSHSARPTPPGSSASIQLPPPQ